MDVNGLQVDVTNIKVANATLDNAANLTDHTYTSSDTMQQQRYTNWSRASGLDSWLTSTVIAGAPNLSTTTDGRELRGWVIHISTHVCSHSADACMREVSFASYDRAGLHLVHTGMHAC